MGAARKHPAELRDRAIRLVLDLVKDQDASVTAACRKVGGELGIKPDTLRGWAKQAQIDRGVRGAGAPRRTSGMKRTVARLAGMGVVNHYYFYCVDEEFGPVCVKFSSYFFIPAG